MLLYAGEEMHTAEMAVCPAIEEYRGPGTEGTPGLAVQAAASTHYSPPVCDPDEPDLIVIADNGIFRDECPVPGDDHLVGIDAFGKENPVEGHRPARDHPFRPVRQDEFHSPRDYGRAGFLNIPLGDFPRIHRLA